MRNAARFALMNLPETAPAPVALESVEGLHHQWILHRLEQVKQDMDKALEEYRFNDAAQLGYKFLWNEFCDWYLELIKPDMQDEARKPVAQYVLWVVLRELLLLLHPIIPFVTAEIWNALPVPAGEHVVKVLTADGQALSEVTSVAAGAKAEVTLVVPTTAPSSLVTTTTLVTTTSLRVSE